MRNEEHLKIRRQGVEAWNGWWEENPEDRPDLRGANLDGAKSLKLIWTVPTLPKTISPELTSSAPR